MADSLVEIILRIKDEGSAVISKVQKDLKQFSDTSKTSAASSSALATSTKEGTTAFSALEEGVGNVTSSLRVLVAAGIAYQALSMAKGFADDAAQSQQAAAALTAVGNNAGIATSKLEGLVAQLQGVGLADEEAAASLTKFIQTGLGGPLNQSIDKITELGKAAQTLAAISGKSVAETLGTLQRGVQFSNERMFRQVNLVLDLKKANEDYAKSLGKTVAELTKAEKQQATMNAVLEASGKFTSAAADLSTTVTNEYKAMNLATGELSDEMGQGLLPAYAALIQEMTLFADQARTIVETENAMGDSGSTLAGAVSLLAGALRETALVLFEYRNVIYSVVAAWVVFKGAIAVGALFVAVRGALLGLLASIGGIVPVTAAAAIEMNALAAAQARVGVSAALGARVVPVLAASVTTLGAAAGAAATRFGALGLAALGLTTPLGLVVAGVAAAAGLVFLGYKAAEAFVEWRDGTSEVEVATDSLTKALEEELDAKRALAKVPAGNIEERRQKQEELNAIKEKIVQAKEELRKATEGGTGDGAASKAASLAKLSATNAINAQKELQNTLTDTRAAIGIVGTDGGVAMSKLIERTKQLEKQQAAMVTELSQLPLDERPAKMADDIRILALQFDGLTKEAKTSAEIMEVLNQLKLSGFIGQTEKGRKEAERLRGVLEAKLQKSFFDDAVANMAHYDAEVKKVLGTLSDMESALEAVGGAAADMEKASIATGDLEGAYDGGLRGIKHYEKTLQDSTARISAIEIRELSSKLGRDKRKYDAAVQLAKQVVEIERAQNANGKGNAVEVANKEIAATGRLNSALKAAYQTRVTDLKASLAEARGLYEKYGASVVAIEGKIAALRTATASTLRDLKRKEMTEEGVNVDKLQEVHEIDSQISTAMANKEYDKAVELAQKKKALAVDLQSFLGSRKASNLVEEAAAAEEAALLKQKAAALDAKKAAEEQAATMVTALNTVSEELNKITGGEAKDIKLGLDNESVKRVIADIQNAFKDVTIKLNVQAAGGAERRAAGGLITGAGTGTSDSVPIWGSNGEFVMKYDAVKAYGVGFMHMINNMAFPRHSSPRFAGGGEIGGASSSASGSASSINLSFNGKRTGTLFGDKKAINGLVQALRAVEGGL